MDRGPDLEHVFHVRFYQRVICTRMILGVFYSRFITINSSMILNFCRQPCSVLCVSSHWTVRYSNIQFLINYLKWIAAYICLLTVTVSRCMLLHLFEFKCACHFSDSWLIRSSGFALFPPSLAFVGQL